jgi:hypothetical protein
MQSTAISSMQNLSLRFVEFEPERVLIIIFNGLEHWKKKEYYRLHALLRAEICPCMGSMPKLL